MKRLVLLALFLGACGGDEPPLSDATSLECPNAGQLPFRLESSSFQNTASKNIAANEPRSKDEAADIIGNPDGASADTYLSAGDPNGGANLPLLGRKAVTAIDSGYFSDPFAGEFVSLWFYDMNAAEWQTLGRTQTDDQGHYEVDDSGFVAPVGEPIYAMLEGNGTCTKSYNYLLPSTTKVVVTDIDGTLTSDDDQLIMQIADGTYVPHQKTAADTLMQTWDSKGYTIVYLTARLHTFRPETRTWLEDLDYPTGPMITAADLSDASAYKAAWLHRMIDDFGWQVVAAYGNATTDISAYADAGIPTDITFIIGPNAGMGGTQPIANDDYTQHIADFVEQQPDNN